FGVEAWNSYTSTYPRRLQLRVINLSSMALKNGNLPASQILLPINGSPAITNYGATNFVTNWAGRQFHMPLLTNTVFLQDSAYRFNLNPRFVQANAVLPFDRTGTFPIPQWSLFITNRLEYFAIDTVANRIVDYVSLTNLVTDLDITRAIAANVTDPDGKF